MGEFSPYIRAVAIDYANCTHARAMTLYACNAPYQTAQQELAPQCNAPEGASTLFVSVDPTYGLNTTGLSSLTQLAGAFGGSKNKRPGFTI